MFISFIINTPAFQRITWLFFTGCSTRQSNCGSLENCCHPELVNPDVLHYRTTLIDTCSPSISTGSDLSRSVVERLCRSGLVSPRRYNNPDITYANLFCLMCNVDLNWTNIASYKHASSCSVSGGRFNDLQTPLSYLLKNEDVQVGKLNRKWLKTKFTCSRTVSIYKYIQKGNK